MFLSSVWDLTLMRPFANYTVAAKVMKEQMEENWFILDIKQFGSLRYSKLNLKKLWQFICIFCGSTGIKKAWYPIKVDKLKCIWEKKEEISLNISKVEKWEDTVIVTLRSLESLVHEQ